MVNSSVAVTMAASKLESGGVSRLRSSGDGECFAFSVLMTSSLRPAKPSFEGTSFTAPVMSLSASVVATTLLRLLSVLDCI